MIFSLFLLLKQMYSSGNTNQPILPISNLNPTVISDYFDEITVINDDLNINNFFYL